MPVALLAGLTLIAQAMVSVPASDMAPPHSPSASTTAAEAATLVQRGRVVAAPHDGFDLGSGLVAQRVASELRWGLVVAQEYRKTSARRWYDVNRPTERRWIPGAGFDPDRSYSPRAREVYEAYQERVRQAAEVSAGDPLRFLLEIHAHERRVTVHGVTVPLMAIEVASNGFSQSELRALKETYLSRVAQLPAEARVPLAIDDLDPRYDYRGERISFYFRATGARNEGSLRTSQTRRALHMELPPIVVAVPELRAVYARIIAAMVRPYSAAGGSVGIAGTVSGQ